MRLLRNIHVKYPAPMRKVKYAFVRKLGGDPELANRMKDWHSTKLFKKFGLPVPPLSERREMGLVNPGYIQYGGRKIPVAEAREMGIEGKVRPWPKRIKYGGRTFTPEAFERLISEKNPTSVHMVGYPGWKTACGKKITKDMFVLSLHPKAYEAFKKDPHHCKACADRMKKTLGFNPLSQSEGEAVISSAHLTQKERRRLWGNYELSNKQYADSNKYLWNRVSRTPGLNPILGKSTDWFTINQASQILRKKGIASETIPQGRYVLITVPSSQWFKAKELLSRSSLVSNPAWPTKEEMDKHYGKVRVSCYNCGYTKYTNNYPRKFKCPKCRSESYEYQMIV